MNVGKFVVSIATCDNFMLNKSIRDALVYILDALININEGVVYIREGVANRFVANDIYDTLSINSTQACIKLKKKGIINKILAGIDNGKVFAKRRKMAQTLELNFYFCGL